MVPSIFQTFTIFTNPPHFLLVPTLKTAEDQFIVPDWGDKVDYGIGLSTGPSGYIHRLAGRYDNPMHSGLYPPKRDCEFG